MSQQNIDAMHGAFQVLNSGDFERTGEFLAPDFISHEVPPEYGAGIDGWIKYFTDFRAGFPDLHFTIDETVSEGDTVVCHCTMTGTHQGDFMGITATGKRVEIRGVDIAHFSGGKGVEHWGYYDETGMMQQLGVMEQ